MGVRPKFYVMEGVVYSRRQLDKIDKINEGKILLQWFANTLYHIHNSDERYTWDWVINPFVIRKKNGTPVKPARYIWTNRKRLAKKLAEATSTEDFLELLEPYYDHKKWKQENYLDTIFFPYEYYGPAPIGFKASGDLRDDLAYALCHHLDIQESKVIEIKGTRPWETGISKYQGKWAILNAHALIPNQRKHTNKLASPIWIRKSELIAEAKKLFEKYSLREPYKLYRNEAWYYSYPLLHRADMLYKSICQITDIKYDQKKVGRFIYVHWC